jgi:purine-nucleoside phosphorylase
LRALGEQVAASENVPFQKGVYVCVAGPSFETPADSRFLRLIGADAVGMSTVPEVIIARHGGTRVLGLSGISNVIPLDGAAPSETSHEEVLEAGAMLVPRLLAIVSGILRQL